ncbi:hypothetical protein [Alienimonas sp. DA493]|uniref:hypothetical protein n=1 Tax=Alienimonas sp. DA493 TaxID=3373605 RepID=UPI0037552107
MPDSMIEEPPAPPLAVTRSTADVLAAARSAAPVDPAEGRRMGATKTRGQKLAAGAMKLVRRIHLFSGIFMFPFVLLYGFTGWFFNHPRLFTGDEVRTFAAAEFESSEARALAELPTPEETADAVIEELNVQGFLFGGPEFARTDARRPTYNRAITLGAAAEDGTSHSMQIDPIRGSGEVRTTLPADPAGGEPPADPLGGIAFVQLRPGADALTVAEAAAPAALGELGLETSGPTTAGRRTPSLSFSATADGAPITVTYALGSGAVSAKADDADAGPTDYKRFLQRLHLARGYTPQKDTRWIWAVVVDAMFVSMVFWGVSGLFMWWQVKRTRTVGAALLVLAVLFSAYLAVEMHAEFALAGGRGGR